MPIPVETQPSGYIEGSMDSDRAREDRQTHHVRNTMIGFAAGAVLVPTLVLGYATHRGVQAGQEIGDAVSDAFGNIKDGVMSLGKGDGVGLIQKPDYDKLASDAQARLSKETSLNVQFAEVSGMNRGVSRDPWGAFNGEHAQGTVRGKITETIVIIPPSAVVNELSKPKPPAKPLVSIDHLGNGVIQVTIPKEAVKFTASGFTATAFEGSQGVVGKVTDGVKETFNVIEDHSLPLGETLRQLSERDALYECAPVLDMNFEVAAKESFESLINMSASAVEQPVLVFDFEDRSMPSDVDSEALQTIAEGAGLDRGNNVREIVPDTGSGSCVVDATEVDSPFVANSEDVR